MAQKPETKIVNAIQQWVNDHNGNVLKLHGSSMQRSGEPDLIGGIISIYEGTEYATHFAVEAKLPGELPRPLQVYRMNQWAKVGYWADTVYSLDDFITKLVQHIKTCYIMTHAQTGLTGFGNDD